MGRRKQPADVQAAMGFPGRRPSEVKRALRALKAADAAIDAEGAPVDPFAPPAYFRRSPAYYRRALQLWGELTDILRAAGRRRPGYRQALARYCLWSQIEEEAFEMLRKQCPAHDYTIKWTPVGGTERQGLHPAFQLMKEAQPICRELEGQFGFTPKADTDIERVETFNLGNKQGQLPFGQSSSERRSDTPSDDDPMDLMNAADSAPPGGLN